MIERKCKGCGAILQDQNPEEKGFIPTLSKESRYCKRCFRMMHYNELPKIVAFPILIFLMVFNALQPAKKL